MSILRSPGIVGFNLFPRGRRSGIPALVLVFLGFAVPALGQDARGSITGRVTDPQGAVIAGAAVTVNNIETNLSSHTSTNETGYFEVTLLNPGKYTVTVEVTGFKK